MSEAHLLALHLAEDMRPLANQFHAAVAHSSGAIAGALTGHAAPDRSDPPATLDEVANELAGATSALENISPDELDELQNRPVVFAAGERQVHFTGETYLLSFAQPNFFFHVTIAYAILRHEGAQIGKRDYMGKMRRAG